MKNLIAIFIDTNKLGGRSSEKIQCSDLHIDKIIPSNDFISLSDFIKSYNLTERVKIYIAEITEQECKQHLNKNLRDAIDYLIQVISDANKKLGNELVSIDVSKLKEEDQYQTHIDEIFNQFLVEHNCDIIQYYRDVSFLENLVTRSVEKHHPFKEAKANKKTYTDAGFKDAILAETIIKYQKSTKTKCYLLTDDNDFEKAFKNIDNIESIKESESLIKELKIEFKLDEVEIIKSQLNEEYWIETLVRETGNPYDESVSNYQIGEIEKKEDNLYEIQSSCTINEAIYNFTVLYEFISREIIDIQYNQEND